MFEPIKISNVVVEGYINQTFEIDSFYEKIEPNARIDYIVAPRKKGQPYRIKTFNNACLDKKKKNNKGRPLTVKAKKKYQDSVKTAIMFFIRSNDPEKKEDHRYNIKYYTGGLVNITGITEMDYETREFNPYLNEVIELFKVYLENFFKRELELEFNLRTFAGINFKSTLIAPSPVDRDKTYKILHLKASKNRSTDRAHLKEFVTSYVDGKVDLDILDTCEKNDLKIKDDYLLSILTYNFKELHELQGYCSQSFYKELKKGFVDYIYCDLLIKLYNHKSNLIYSISPKNTSKRGLGIKFILGTNGVEPIIRCVNIFKNSYNSSCKDLEEGHKVNDIINSYFAKYGKLFLISNDIVFKLIL
jgi:hypothetical protein